MTAIAQHDPTDADPAVDPRQDRHAPGHVNVSAVTDAPELAADLAEAFTVLADAVTTLDQPGHTATASQVRVEMDRRTWGGFNPRRFNFKRFQDFVRAAADAGVVAVDWDRAGDIALFTPTPAGQPAASTRIRRDLYTALVDWSGVKVRVYHRNKDQVYEFPRERAPLEPEHITKLRNTWRHTPSEYIEIPSIDFAEQQAWMTTFAQSRRDPFLREQLLDALNTSKPARDFIAVLRQHPGDLQSWKRELQDHVRLRAQQWRDDNAPGVRIDHDGAGQPPTENLQPDSDAPSTTTPSADTAGTLDAGTSSRSTPSIHRAGPASAARPGAAQEPGTSPTGHPKRLRTRPGQDAARSVTTDWNARDREVRDRLHRAIETMPLADLLAITLPIGYFLAD